MSIQPNLRSMVALGLLLTASAAAGPQSSEGLTVKEAKRAEKEAKTAADHLRLASYYRSKARRAQANVAEEEAEMQRWGSMADRTKIPNPYWSARQLARMYREEAKEATKRAVAHEKMAEGLY
jgi:hypothetical protein